MLLNVGWILSNSRAYFNSTRLLKGTNIFLSLCVYNEWMNDFDDDFYDDDEEDGRRNRNREEEEEEFHEKIFYGEALCFSYSRNIPNKNMSRADFF